VKKEKRKRKKLGEYVDETVARNQGTLEERIRNSAFTQPGGSLFGYAGEIN